MTYGHKAENIINSTIILKPRWYQQYTGTNIHIQYILKSPYDTLAQQADTHSKYASVKIMTLTPAVATVCEINNKLAFMLM